MKGSCSAVSVTIVQYMWFIFYFSDGATNNNKTRVCFSGRPDLHPAAFRKFQSILMFSNVLCENRIFYDEKYFELCMGEYY